MALHWRPVGPEPEQTYWQRRALVAVPVLVLLVLLGSLLTGGDGEPDTVAQQPAASPAPSTAPSVGPLATASPTPTPSPTPSVAPCAPGALDVDAAATEDDYRVGAAPRLELRISTTGNVPCTADVGQAAVELLVFSGSDRIWSSDDCAPGGGARVATLVPGKAEISRVTWSGTRSAPGCTGDKAKAQPGTYRVAARVGQQRVEGKAFEIEG